MTLIYRVINLAPSSNFLPLLSIISPKPTFRRIHVQCKIDESNDIPQRKSRRPMSRPSINPKRKSSNGASRSREFMGWEELYLHQGVHGLGGRMGTRAIDSQPLIFDHATQFFTVADPEFAKLVDLWTKNDLVRQWDDVVGELEASGRLVPLTPLPRMYIGANGMRPLADSILSEGNCSDYDSSTDNLYSKSYGEEASRAKALTYGNRGNLKVLVHILSL